MYSLPIGHNHKRLFVARFSVLSQKNEERETAAF
jgi:hypothetical protein